MLKYLFDTLVAAVMLVLLSPVILACILIIRVNSTGPGIFRQTRVGRHERSFTCYKLRTMYVTTKNVPTHEASASSITSIGHFLRRTKLDELPQLLNVVRGDMSFVGPRPCLPQQEELVRLRREQDIFSLRPGITGLAQVQNVDMSDPVRLSAIDANYLRQMSFLTDLQIVFRTVVGGGQGDKIAPGDTR
jgi:O-antigen biosynthesis protein WbqP